MKRAALVLLVMLATIGTAHAGALDERAPVAVQISPREAAALHGLLNRQTFKGDDQEAEARVSEALGFAALDAEARKIKREQGRDAVFDDYSDKRVARMIPRDDAARVIEWLRAADIPGVFNEVLAPLMRELKRATSK